jgi:hypothetical protein
MFILHCLISCISFRERMVISIEDMVAVNGDKLKMRLVCS